MAIFGALPQAAKYAMMPAEAKKPKFFGEGGSGRAIAGHIGDALLQMNGMRPIYAPAMEDQRAFSMRQRLAETEGAQPREVGGNLVRLNPQSGQYEVVYKGQPKSGSPHYWETNDGSLGRVNPDTGQPEILYKDPQPRMNFIPDGLGGGQWVAVPSAAPNNLQVPTKPVGKLTPIQGGPTPSASGGFR